MKYAFSATLFIVGLIIVLISSQFGSYANLDLTQMGSAAGSFICSAAIFSAYFELRGKQEFSEYVWREANAAIEVKEAGISGFMYNAKRANLSDEIKNANSVIYITTYSSQFLKRYENELSTCLSRGGRVKIVVQNENSPTIKAMKSLEAWDSEGISANYRENNSILSRLKKMGDIMILYHHGVRAYSCVIVDSRAHVSFATNSNGRMEIPRISADSDGSLFRFLKKDAERVIEQSNE